MNIHEHQAKEILREYGAPVSNGIVILSLDNIKLINRGKRYLWQWIKGSFLDSIDNRRDLKNV